MSHLHFQPIISITNKQNPKTYQSKRSDDVLLAIHRQASQQLPLHAALVGQLFQGCLRVLSLCPLLPAADQEFFLRWRKAVKMEEGLEYLSTTLQKEEKSVRNCLLPPGRGFRIKSTTSFQSFLKIALPQTKGGNNGWVYRPVITYNRSWILSSCHNSRQYHHVTTLPANLLCRHSCGAKALHAIIVDEACLPEGCHGLTDLLICPWDVPDIQIYQQIKILWVLESCNSKVNTFYFLWENIVNLIH